MTSIRDLQKKIEDLVTARDKLRVDVREAQHQADLARQEAEEKRIAADKTRSEFQSQIDALGAEIASRQTEFDTVEFFGVAEHMDRRGETPEMLARWWHCVAALRSARPRRIGIGHEMAMVTVARLRGLKAPALDPKLRSWTSLARAWCSVDPTATAVTAKKEKRHAKAGA
jgi:hypothetical protein